MAVLSPQYRIDVPACGVDHAVSHGELVFDAEPGGMKGYLFRKLDHFALFHVSRCYQGLFLIGDKQYLPEYFILVDDG